jgi:hypothetical protein
LKCTRRVTLHRGMIQSGDRAWRKYAGARGKVKPGGNTRAPIGIRSAHGGTATRRIIEAQ